MLNFKIKIYVVFVLANSVDPDEMPLYAMGLSAVYECSIS